MSLKSATEELKKSLRYSREAVLSRGGEISATAGLKDFPLAIANIPNDSSLAFYEDSDIAYRKIVPEKMEAYAMLKKLGGMTYKSKNLAPYPYVETTKTENGITFTDNGNGTITVNGTATEYTYFTLFSNIKSIPKTTLTLSGCPSGYSQIDITLNFAREDGSTENQISDYGNSTTFDSSNWDYVAIDAWIEIPSGTVCDNLTFKPMLNEGATALPYEPYFNGLRDSKVTELVSEGANLAHFRGWSAAPPTNDNPNLLVLSNSYGTTISTTEAVNSITVTQTKQDRPNDPVHYSNGYFIYVLKNHLEYGKKYKVSFDLEVLKNPLSVTQVGIFFNGISLVTAPISERISALCEYVVNTYYPNRSVIEIRNCGMDFVISNVMITEEAVTDITYKPLVDTLDRKPIPEAVQALDGYGIGINADYYNYIEWRDGRVYFHRNAYEFTYTKDMRVGVLPIDGQSTPRFYVQQNEILAKRKGNSDDTVGKLISLSDRFNYISYHIDEVGYYLDSGSKAIYFKVNCASVEEAKEYIDGAKFIFALEEPEVIDITHLFTEDSFIKVEGGGTITMANEYEYAVPSEIKYVRKVTETGGGSGGYDIVYQSGYSSGFDDGEYAITSKLTEIEITENGEYVPTEGSTGFKSAKVDVTPNLQEKSVTENGEYTADEGYDGLSKVTVNVSSSGGENLWQALIDARGCYYLFGTSSSNTNITDKMVADILNGVDTINVTSMSNMFRNSTALTSVPLFDTSNVTSMGSMFQDCYALTTVPLFDTSNVTSMTYMFSSCSGLTTLPLFNISKVTNMTGAFQGCSRLTAVPLFDTSKVTSMSSAFTNCSKLTTIPQLDTSKVTSMGSAFEGCSSLVTVPELDVRNSTSFSSIFSNCRALTEIWIRNIKTNLQVGSGTSYGHLLTVDSLVHLCYELRDTGSVKTLTVGTANLAKLADVYVRAIEITDEMRAEDDLVDEKLPFVRCESTDEGATLISDYILAKNWKLA